MKRPADTDRSSTDREMGSDSEVVVVDSDSSNDEPVRKSARFDTEPNTPPPSPSSDCDELRQGIFQRALLQARDAEMRADQSDLRADELGLRVEEADRAEEESKEKLRELSKQLKEANRKAEKYTNKNVRLIHENIQLKEELEDAKRYVSELERRKCELVEEKKTYGPETQIRSVKILARRNNRKGVSNAQLRDRKRYVTRRSKRITVEETSNVGKIFSSHYNDGDPVNVFQLCRPNTLDSISVTSALTQLSAKFTRTREESWRKYCGECSFEVLRCEVCETVIRKVDVFEHFFTEKHIELVRSADAGVSLPAVQHWLRELQQAAAAAAAEAALAAMSAAAAAAAAVTPEQQQEASMKRCLEVLQHAIISSIAIQLS